MIELTRKRIGAVVAIIGVAVSLWWALDRRGGLLLYGVGACLLASGSVMRCSSGQPE